MLQVLIREDAVQADTNARLTEEFARLIELISYKTWHNLYLGEDFLPSKTSIYWL